MRRTPRHHLWRRSFYIGVARLFAWPSPHLGGALPVSHPRTGVYSEPVGVPSGQIRAPAFPFATWDPESRPTPSVALHNYTTVANLWRSRSSVSSGRRHVQCADIGAGAHGLRVFLNGQAHRNPLRPFAGGLPSASPRSCRVRRALQPHPAAPLPSSPAVLDVPESEPALAACAAWCAWAYLPTRTTPCTAC